MDFQLAKSVLAALEREGVRYAVFGAGALNLLGLPRFTKDLDLFIAPEADNVARLRQALRSGEPFGCRIARTRRRSASTST